MTDKAKETVGSIEAWYEIVVNEVRKAGHHAPSWESLSARETRAWTLAYASQVEMSIRMLDAMELTIPGLLTQ